MRSRGRPQKGEESDVDPLFIAASDALYWARRARKVRTRKRAVDSHFAAAELEKGCESATFAFSIASHARARALVMRERCAGV